MNDEKLKIIYIALDSLENSPLLKGMWKYVVNNGKRIEINLYIRDKPLKYTVEARHELRVKQVATVLANNNPAETIVIAEKIYADAKEQLVANNIAYIEANGNIFIPDKELYIWVDTNKPAQKIKPLSSRAFTKTGLKVVFHFLLNEAFLNMSYRQIAEDTGTSLGNITNIINALKELNFVVKNADNNLRLNNKKQLAEKWMDTYEHELKPAMEIGTFRFANDSDYSGWRRVPLENKKTVWGGEPGAHLMTGMLKPSKLTIYTTEDRNELINKYQMVRDPDGYIKVYRKFWNYNDYRSTITPPLLIYADLLNTGEPKNLEAAQRIFDDVLKDKIT